MKYETKLRLDFNNTMSIMVKEIKENSSVLEFGPASGRLTQYLRDEKSCNIYIVELDEEAGKIAAEFAVEAVIGDIETYEWLDKFKDIRFDYILFADVLEHLRNPEIVLERCKEVLKEDGYILISLPNIAHNSVIIDLMKGKFEYQSTGLLDNTHIRFWTYETIEKTFKDLGFNIEAKFGTYTQVGKNEFNNTYEEIEKLNPFVLKSREMGEVYQFVYKITKQQVDETRDEIRRNNEYYYLQWYFDFGAGLDENNTQKRYIDFKQKIELLTIKVPEGTKKLRVDPLNSQCAVKIRRLTGINNGHEEEIQIESSNADLVTKDFLLFLKNDGQLYIEIEKLFDTVIIEMEYVAVDAFDYNKLVSTIVKQVENFRIMAEQKENYINELRQDIDSKEKIISNKEKIISEKEKIIYEKISVINEKIKIIEKMQKFLNKPVIHKLFEMHLKRGKRD